MDLFLIQHLQHDFLKFFKTSLKSIDLSSSFIDGIVISLEDIKGAIINEYQAINLIALLGVKIKE